MTDTPTCPPPLRLVLTLEYVGPEPRQAIRPDLARALKRLLRLFNWKCVSIEDPPCVKPVR